MFTLALGLIYTWGIVSSFGYESGSTREDTNISITFDDGPHPTRTRAILDILKERNIHATFFVLGSRIKKNESLMRSMIQEGHMIGNHSFSHPDFRKIETVKIINEILFTDIAIFSTTGTWPKYFRFPYGDIDPRIRYIYHDSTVAWNVDAYDWKAKNPHTLAVKILSQVHTGSIILLHDIKEDTVKALPEILDGLREKGYHFVSLDQLLIREKKKRNMIFYTAKSAKPIPQVSQVPLAQLQKEEYHPRGTEASEETLRW